MKHNIGISGIRVKSNSLLLALFLLLVWCVQIVPGLGNAYAQYVYPAIARVLSSFSRLGSIIYFTECMHIVIWLG